MSAHPSEAMCKTLGMKENNKTTSPAASLSSQIII